MSKNKDKQQAQQREAESYNILKEDRQISRDQAQSLQKNQKDRLKPYFDLQNKSQQFLDGVDSGKDITDLLDGELKFRDEASNRAKATSRMYQNTGARAIMGSPDANFQYQMDKEKDLQEGEDYATQALNLYLNAKDQNQSNLLNATNAISGDDYNISNVLNGQTATSAGVWKGDMDRRVETENRPSWFSKYVMPIAQASAGGITSWLTGGMSSLGKKK